MTCCALHNMLLEVDGLDDEWQSGVKGDWEGDWGLHENEDSLKFAVPRDQACLVLAEVSIKLSRNLTRKHNLPITTSA